MKSTSPDEASVSTIVDTSKVVKAPKFTISVLCYNHQKLTAKCLESVLKHSSDYELYVTNNASSDGTRKYLDEFKNRTGPHVHVIHNDTNKGFQEPNKYVLSQAKGEYLVLLNNDMETCPNWLTDIHRPFIGNPKMAVTGLEGTCCRLNNDYKAVGGSPLEYVEGSCLMIPTALARQHGLFADYLKFIYWEDTDLGFRMRELGYELETIAIPMKHRHPSSTTRHMDLRDIRQANADAFKKRWSYYFKRRDFKRRLLIRRLGARGDVLLLTPALRALRNKWPQAELHIQTKHPEMLIGMDGVRFAVEKKGYFDDFIDLDLSYEARPDLHIVQAYCQKLDVPYSPNWKIEMFPTEQDLCWGYRKARGLKVALIHGGVTTWPGKNWPVDRMTELVKLIKQEGFFTIAVGAADSPQCGCDDSVAGESTPQQLYALAKRASLFVGLDSMPQHIASAANVPSVVVFGPTNPARIVRPYPTIIPVQGTTAEAPCVGEHGRRKVACTQAPCEGDCMKIISVDKMFKAVKRAMALTR